MNASIPHNIKRLRRQAGLTQEQLAEKLFVTRQTISLWELGKSKPDIDTLQALADCFQTDLMTVLYGHSGENEKRERLKSNLIRWGVVTGVLWILYTIALEIFDYLKFELFSLACGTAFVWLKLWGGPILGTCSGGVLALLLRGRVKKSLWWLVPSLPCWVLVLYYVWYWYVQPSWPGAGFPYLNWLAWHLPSAPWAFLLLGFGAGMGGSGVRMNETNAANLL